MSATRAVRRTVVEDLAIEIGRLRRCADIDHVQFRLDTIVGLVEWLWIWDTSTAHELFIEGLGVDEALRLADTESRRFHRLIAADMSEKRRLDALAERKAPA